MNVATSIITPSNDAFPTRNYLVIVVTRPNGFDKHDGGYIVLKNYFSFTFTLR